MISEQVNMNHRWRVQNIMFCGLWAFSCSPVHLGDFWAVLSGFLLFLLIQFILFFLLSNELVSKCEEHCCSMRQFEMELVNK